MLKFRLVLPKGEYLRAMVFDDKETFVWEATRLSEKIGRKTRFDNAEAACFGWKEYDNRRRTKLVGAVLFYKGRISSGVISHEMTHAMFNWSRFHKRASEEALCIIQGDLVSQFWKHYLKGGKNGN